MESSDLTPRQYYEQIKANPNRARFGFGCKAAVVNIDIQNAYTQVGEFATAYETHPNQLGFVNEIVGANRGVEQSPAHHPIVGVLYLFIGVGHRVGVA